MKDKNLEMGTDFNNSQSQCKTNDGYIQLNLPFFIALCMFLSAVEFSIPKPLPFIKIGLANLPILICLGNVKFSDYVKLVIAKILCGGIIGGTLFSYVFVFSLCGSISSAIIMWVLFKLCKNHLSLIGISLMGSLGNNLALLICSKYMMFGNNVKYLAPLLLISGFISGLLLGIFANLFVSKSEWYKMFSGNQLNPQESFALVQEFSTGGKVVEFDFKLILWSLVCFACILLLVFIRNIYVDLIIVFVFLVINLALKNKLNLASLVMVTVFICLFSCLNPYGKVILSVWKFKVTDLALLNGVRRSSILVGMLLISKTMLVKNKLTNVSSGNFIGKVLNYLSLLQKKPVNHSKNVISLIDERLLACFNVSEKGEN